MDENEYTFAAVEEFSQEGLRKFASKFADVDWTPLAELIEQNLLRIK